MVLENGDSKRVGIFFMYDKDGVVDDYVIVMLRALKNHFARIIVVANGVLTVEGRKKFNEITHEIVVRENKGFDSWAYKTGIEYIGWDKLNDYDELIMFNFTIMGPVNSFDEMFEDMDSRDLDFWGITKWFSAPFDPFGCIKYGYLPDHLQSHFIAVRRTMLLDVAFKKYWDELPPITSYEEAVGKHEAIFTKTFADMGYAWDSYVKMDDLRGHNWGEIMFNPVKLVKERKCPIFKRRMFLHDYGGVLRNTIGNIPRDFLEYLDKEKKYDVNLVMDNIIRSAHQEDFVRNLNFHYVLDSKRCDESTVNLKTVLIMHVFYEDMIDCMLTYSEYMPEETDIFITVVSSRTYDEVISKISNHPSIKDRTSVRIIENRGRDVSSLLVGVKDVVMNYDLACFIHDKKSPQQMFGSIAEGFANVCYGNTVYSRAYVKNVIRLFEKNERLGIASPPFPAHADFFTSIGGEWGPNFDITLELYKKLGLTVPLTYEKRAIAPYGTCFWFRPKALKKLYEHDWDYSEFPKEPNKNDETLLHAIERIYPFVAQQMGYYPAIIMSDYYAGIEYSELEYYVSQYNKKLFLKYGYHYFDDMLRVIDCGNIYYGNWEDLTSNSSETSSAIAYNDRAPVGPTWKRTIYWLLFDHDMLKLKIHNKFHKSKS